MYYGHSMTSSWSPVWHRITRRHGMTSIKEIAKNCRKDNAKKVHKQE